MRLRSDSLSHCPMAAQLLHCMSDHLNRNTTHRGFLAAGLSKLRMPGAQKAWPSSSKDTNGMTGELDNHVRHFIYSKHIIPTSTHTISNHCFCSATTVNKHVLTSI